MQGHSGQNGGVMKTILILTDFSENAGHAALEGAMLSQQMHANLLLLNTNTSQPVIPQYAGDINVIDEFNNWEAESKANLKKLADSLEPLMLHSDLLRKPSVSFQSGIGNLGYMVKEISRHKDIDLVVMGAPAGGTIEHLLSGSETFSVIDRSPRPVLIVPPIPKTRRFKKIIFATDYNMSDLDGIRYLVKLGNIFNCAIEIVHINPYGQHDTDETKKEIFLKHVHRLKYPHITFSEIHGKDIINRLNKLCEQEKADLLAFVHYNHSFFSALLQRGVVKKAVKQQEIPVMVFPPEMAG